MSYVIASSYNRVTYVGDGAASAIEFVLTLTWVIWEIVVCYKQDKESRERDVI